MDLIKENIDTKVLAKLVKKAVGAKDLNIKHKKPELKLENDMQPVKNESLLKHLKNEATMGLATIELKNGVELSTSDIQSIRKASGVQVKGHPGTPKVISINPGSDDSVAKVVAAVGKDKVQKIGGAELLQSKRLGESDKKPVEHTVKLTMSLKDVAEALGYKEWAKMNDYLDADGFDDIYHNGYSSKDAQHMSVKGMDDVEKIFPEAVAIAAETGERDGYAAAIGKARRDAVVDALEKISVPGEYLDADSNSISKAASIKSASIDGDKITIEIENPEHLLNDIVNGVGYVYPEMDPFEKASDKEIEGQFLANIGDYFEVYGDSKPDGELDSRFSPDVDDDFVAEEVKFRAGEMSVDEIAEAVVDAVDDERIDSEKEAIELAAKYSGTSKSDIAKAVKALLGSKAEKLHGRAGSVPEESISNGLSVMIEGKTYGYVVSEGKEEIMLGFNYLRGLLDAGQEIDSDEANDHMKEALGMSFDDIQSAYEMIGDEMPVDEAKDEVKSILIALNSTGDLMGKYPIGNKELTQKVKDLEAAGKISYDDKFKKWSKGKAKKLSEDNLDDKARELIAVFEKNVGIDKSVSDEIGEKDIGDVSFRYGGREVSAITPDGKIFIWDVNSIGDRHSYVLFDIWDENGESIDEAVKNKYGPKFKAGDKVQFKTDYDGTFKDFKGKSLTVKEFHNVVDAGGGTKKEPKEDGHMVSLVEIPEMNLIKTRNLEKVKGKPMVESPEGKIRGVVTAKNGEYFAKVIGGREGQLHHIENKELGKELLGKEVMFHINEMDDAVDVEVIEKPVVESFKSDGPGIYVGTYGKYASGSIEGKWLNPEDYNDADEFLEAAREVHKDEADPELMFQDYQGFPEMYYGESHIKPELWDWLAMSEDDREMLEAYGEVVGSDYATLEKAQEAFQGKFDSEEDWAIQFLDDTDGINSMDDASLAHYLNISDTDARLIAVDDVDSRLSDMSEDDILEQADMTDEHEAEEDEAKKEAIVAKARDKIDSEMTDELESKIKDDPIGYFVDELGYEAKDLIKNHIMSFDYKAYAKEAQIGGDVSFHKKDGEVFVFLNH